MEIITTKMKALTKIADMKKFKAVADQFGYEPHAMGFCKKQGNYLIHITSKGSIYCYVNDNGNFIEKTRYKMQIQDILPYVNWRGN